MRLFICLAIIPVSLLLPVRSFIIPFISKHSPITPVCSNMAPFFSQKSSKSTVSKNMTRPSPHSDISGFMSSINYSLQAQSSISSIRRLF
ncbi:hypothetical protein EDD22DRAFT_884562 [Suillus occidentalis]|nr:hypothetical protein EDD22DRAFT_884562 [Suillus occidentalis]